MATYKELHGSQLQNFSSDPSNPINGQMWYNTTSSAFKGYKDVQSWATANNLNTARGYIGGAGALQDAGLAFGGEPGSGTTAATESYNGTNWTSVNNLTTPRRNVGGLGTNTAALCVGGYVGSPTFTGVTETWNGTNWTEVNDLGTVRRNMGCCGSNTAGLGA